MGINQLIANMESMDVTDLVGQSIENTKIALAEVQTEQMLFGKASDGKLIGKYKSQYYAAKKYSMNSLAGYGNVDLRLTNEFQRNVKIVVFKDSVQLFSTDSKADKLVKMYGIRIFGLSVPYAKEYSGVYLKPEGIKVFKQWIYGVH